MFKVIVAGTRSFNDYNLLKEKLDYYLKDKTEVTIVSGHCQGADMLGEQYAKEKNFLVEEYPADWSIGKMAGPIRNEKMAKVADALVAFWDGKSLGTKNMINNAAKYNLNCRTVKIS